MADEDNVSVLEAGKREESENTPLRGKVDLYVESILDVVVLLYKIRGYSEVAFSLLIPVL